MTVEEKIRAVLTDLSTLSEATTSSLEPQTSHGASDGRVPPGVADRLNLLTAERGRPPKKENDLHGWWQWRFTKAVLEEECEFELYRLALLAERDYMARRFHSPDRMALRSGKVGDVEILIWSCPNPSCGRKQDIKPHMPALVCSGDPDPKRPERRHSPEEMVQVADGERADRAAASRIIDLYEGIPAAEVAVHEYQTEDWVKKARRMHGRNPQDGRPRADFLDWPEDRRHREVVALANRDIGLTKAAQRLGVDKNTVKRYWPQPVAAAA